MKAFVCLRHPKNEGDAFPGFLPVYGNPEPAIAKAVFHLACLSEICPECCDRDCRWETYTLYAIDIPDDSSKFVSKSTHYGFDGFFLNHDGRRAQILGRWPLNHDLLAVWAAEVGLAGMGGWGAVLKEYSTRFGALFTEITASFQG